MNILKIISYIICFFPIHLTGQEIGNIDVNYPELSKFLKSQNQCVFFDSITESNVLNKTLFEVRDSAIVQNLETILETKTTFDPTGIDSLIFEQDKHNYLYNGSNLYFVGKLVTLRPLNFDQYLFVELVRYNDIPTTKSLFFVCYLINMKKDTDQVLSKMKVLQCDHMYLYDRDIVYWSTIYSNKKEEIKIDYHFQVADLKLDEYIWTKKEYLLDEQGHISELKK